MVENEFKIMLTKEQYERLCDAYEWDRTVKQDNNYYDTPELLLSKGHITCRVRTLPDGAFLQMKLPNGPAYSRIELEKKLESVPEELSAGEINELAGEYLSEPLPAVRRIGVLTTERRVKRFEGAEIDLDRSSYFGVTDYELEIEFTDKEKASELLARAKKTAGIITPVLVCTGKIHRFLNEYRKNG